MQSATRSDHAAAPAAAGQGLGGRAAGSAGKPKAWSSSVCDELMAVVY
jgi:hypothetical protein